MNRKHAFAGSGLLLIAVLAAPIAAADGANKSRHCKHHDQHHRGMLHAPAWQSTLTPEQQAALDALQVTQVRNTVALKLRMQAVKAELAELTVAGGFQMQQIEAKVDQYLLLKREKMLLELKYRSEQRALLTPEQQMSFDIDIMQKAKRVYR